MTGILGSYEPAATTKDAFDEWCILELMGHRRLAGHVTEQEIAGSSFLRLDVPGPNGTVATQLYSPAAVYCITPVSEDLARRVAASSQPTPVSRWELEPSGRASVDPTRPVPDLDGEPPW